MDENDQNANVRACEPFSGLLVEPCENNAGGCGNASLWEMINSFEELKTKAQQQLEDLKNGNKLLTAKSVCMEKKIALFRNLMFINDFRENFRSVEVMKRTSISPEVTGTGDSISTVLASEIQKMKHNCRMMIHQCAVEAENVKLLTKVDDTLKNEVAEVQWQLERFKLLAEKLEAELITTKEEMLQLRGENVALKKENGKVEEDLWTTRIEVLDLKNEKSSENSGYFSSLNRLEAMKKAFDRNEEIIQKQKQEIADRDILIGKYAEYCRLYKYYNKRSMNDSQTDFEKENTNVCYLINPESTMGVREQQRSLTSEDGFSDTVKSLTGHINDLMVHNETFMEQMPDNLHSSSSNSTQAASSSKTKIMKPSQGCGDVVNEIAVQHLRIVESQESIDSHASVPNASSHPQINSTFVFDELTRMAKSAERLGRSSQDIIKASFSRLDLKLDEHNSNDTSSHYL